MIESSVQMKQRIKAGQHQRHGHNQEAEPAKLICLTKLFSFQVKHGERLLGSMKQKSIAMGSVNYSKSICSTIPGPLGVRARVSLHYHQGDHAPIIAGTCPADALRRSVNLQREHVPFGQFGKLDRMMSAVGRDGPDWLTIKGDGTRSRDLVHFQNQSVSTGFQGGTSKPASQDEPPRDIGTPTHRQVDPPTSDAASPAARHSQPRRSRIRCSLMMIEPSLWHRRLRHAPLRQRRVNTTRIEKRPLRYFKIGRGFGMVFSNCSDYSQEFPETIGRVRIA